MSLRTMQDDAGSSCGTAAWDRLYGTWEKREGTFLKRNADILPLCNRAVSDSYSLLPSDTLPQSVTNGPIGAIPIDYIQGSRHMLEMTRTLFEDATEGAEVRYQRIDKQLGTVSSVCYIWQNQPS